MLAQVLNPMHPQTDSLVTIGQILKPFGIRGDVKVESMSDVPGRFEGLQTVYLTRPHEAAVPMETTVTQVRAVNAGYLVRFSAFSTPEEAAHFHAKGSGTSVPELNRLIKQFLDARRMMKSLVGGQMGMGKGKRKKRGKLIRAIHAR